MRNSKARTFLYVLLGCCMMFAVFMLSSTHSKLKESQESNDKCQQQRDSLSAQLQVVYEHKSRLEKTLQNEIADRKRAEEGTRLLRDQSEKDRADARDKIKSLEQQLSESQVAQAEEFKNLKASYGALDQEKEKINAELASQVTLLQQEREAKLKLARQLEELQQSRRSDTQVAVGLQKQLETCRAETSQLYFKLQQQNLVAPQQQIGGVVNGKPGASADLLAGNEGKLQPGAQAELKPNAKEERAAGKMGSRYQIAGAESRQPKQPDGTRTGNSDAGMGLAGARYPVAAQQALKAPGSDLEPQPAGKAASPHPNDSALGQPPLKVGAAPPLQQDAGFGANNSEQRFVQPGGVEAGENASHLVPSQPGVAARRALQPAGQAVEPSKGPALAVKPEKQLLRPARPLPGVDAGAPEAVMQAPQAAGHGKLEGGGPQGEEPVPIQYAAGRRTTAAAGAADPLQGQLRQPRVQPAEQPPVQQPQEMPALNQIPPVLPAPNLAAARQEPVAVGAKNQGNALDVLDNPGEDLARIRGVPAKGAAAAQGKAGSAKKDVNLDAALQDENEVDGVANLDKPVAKARGGGFNYGKDLLEGAGRAAGGGNRPAQPKLGRPNQPQHAEPENEDDLEYANPVKDDDAAEDQDDDGPFGPGGGRGKAMQDAADFDDQVADADQQQQQQQQFNNPAEAGIAVHPK